MYGLTNAAIAQKLEAQEGAAACEGYVPVKERKKKSHIPQGDGEEEDDSFEFDSASEASPSEASLASEASAMLELSEEEALEKEALLELSEEEALEKEALLEVQALSARRRSRSAKVDKSKRLSAQSKETKVEETVMKMLKRAMVGKDSCLRVRCRRCEGGLEAEDSLMWACGAGLRRSDNVIRVEYPASLFTVKKERVEAKKERTSGKKERVEVKERAGRRGRGEELLPAEAMFDIDMSGTYRTGFEAVGRSEGRVSVKACSSSLLKPKAELVLHKMR